jgi:hypothetical protein
MNMPPLWLRMFCLEVRVARLVACLLDAVGAHEERQSQYAYLGTAARDCFKVNSPLL